jgi:hypothetical protein
MELYYEEKKVPLCIRMCVRMSAEFGARGFQIGISPEINKNRNLCERVACAFGLMIVGSIVGSVVGFAAGSAISLSLHGLFAVGNKVSQVARNVFARAA